VRTDKAHKEEKDKKGENENEDGVNVPVHRFIFGLPPVLSGPVLAVFIAVVY
jgi:hypothetical protein